MSIILKIYKTFNFSININNYLNYIYFIFLKIFKEYILWKYKSF